MEALKPDRNERFHSKSNVDRWPCTRVCAANAPDYN